MKIHFNERSITIWYSNSHSIDDWVCDDDILMLPWFPPLCWWTALESGFLCSRRPPCWLLIHFIEMYSAAELNISNDKKWLAQLGQCMGVLVPKMRLGSCRKTVRRRTNRPKSLPPAYSAPRTMSQPRLTASKHLSVARLLSYHPFPLLLQHWPICWFRVSSNGGGWRG